MSWTGASPTRYCCACREREFCPWSISPDGRFLLFSRYLPETGSDLLLLDLEAAPGAESVKPFVATPGMVWRRRHLPERRVVRLLLDRVRARRAPHREVPGARAKDVGVDRMLRHPGLVARWTGALLHGTSTPGSGERDMMAVGIELTPTLRVSAPRRLFSGATRPGATWGGLSVSRRTAASCWCEPQGAFARAHRLRNPAARGAELVRRAAPEPRKPRHDGESTQGAAKSLPAGDRVKDQEPSGGQIARDRLMANRFGTYEVLNVMHARR